jgi:type I restriction enzyme S subunit
VNGSPMALSEVLKSAEIFVDGDWVESKDQDPDGDVRLIQLADIGDGYYIDKSNRFLTTEAANRLKCTFLEAGDLLLARMPDPLGRVCIFPGDQKKAVTVVDVCIIRADQKKLDPRWLMHCLNAPISRNQINEYVTGTTRSRISRGNLGKIKVSVPSLPEQRRIAAILDQADALRAKRREALAELDKLAQSIFVEMFGDPVTNPKGLEKKPLASLLKVKSGEFLPASAMAGNGSYPVFGGNGINGYHDEYLFEERQIVIGRVGVYCGCVHVTPAKSWVTDNALYVSEHDTKIDFDFLAYSLKLSNLNQHASQSAQPLISGARIYPVEIFVPTPEQQAIFIARINASQLTERQFIDSQANLDDLFASLQHRAFRGEL